MYSPVASRFPIGPDCDVAHGCAPAEGSLRTGLHTFDEFTRLRAVIVGTAYGANHPDIDSSFENFFQPPLDEGLRKRSVGPVPKFVADEIEEDIAEFIQVLTKFGVECMRPTPIDCTTRFRTPLWESSQLYSLMPRDCLLAYGDLFIEVPSPTRSRYFESFAFRTVLEEYVRLGAHVISAPKPMLTEQSFDAAQPHGLSDFELMFDAANVVRLGRDLFLDVNRSANRRSVAWLERTLRGLVSSNIRVHSMNLGTDHADVTLIPLRPGVILIDPAKVTDRTIPTPFRNWERVVVDEVMPTRDYGLPYPLASNDGIGRNCLVLDPSTVVVDEIQLPLIRALERLHFTVIPLRYRHGRTLGGAWHCITLDTHRDGGLEDYLD